MMGSLLLVAGAAGGVALLVALAMQLGFRGVPELPDQREALALAAGLPGGFAAVETGIDATNRAALLADADGRIALVYPHGAHFIARLVPPGSGAVCDGGTLAIGMPSGPVRLELGPAAAKWAVLLQAVAR